MGNFIVEKSDWATEKGGQIIFSFSLVCINTCMTHKEIALHKAYMEWMLQHANRFTHAVTLTLKPYRTVMTNRGEMREVLTPIEAQRNFRQFLNRLNDSIYGNAVKRFDKGIFVIPMLEGKASGKLLHYHCAMGNFRPGLSERAISAKIMCAWHQTPFGNVQVDIVPMRDLGWLHYSGKEIGKAEWRGMRKYDIDVVDLSNLRFPSALLT